MEAFYEIARGPLFRLSFAVMVLGLVRHILLSVFGMSQALSRAVSPVKPFQAPFSKLVRNALSWIFPITKFKQRTVQSLISISFHIGLIIIPLFLAAHIQLFRSGFGIGWSAINQEIADWLTLLVVLTGMILFILRLADKNIRSLSRPQDFLLPVLIAVTFLSGFLAINVNGTPVPYTAMMIIHVMSGNLTIILIPFTKMSHVVLFPFTQMASNYAWRFVPEGGENVLKSLGKEGRV
ncbi:hypothetical protein ACFL5P_03290 [candidate division KSB1 bacterium]